MTQGMWEAQGQYDNTAKSYCKMLFIA